MASTVRDDTYYFSDGNTTLLVSQTLFKVHRSRLIQDQSAFMDMFSFGEDSICVEDGLQEGGSDTTPIYLSGDTVEEFRDLLWCLYALPHEIAGLMSSRSSILRLANIVRMTNKYHFVDTEQWALRTLTSLHSDNIPFTGHPLPLPRVPSHFSRSSLSPSQQSAGWDSDVSQLGVEYMTTHALVQTTEVAVLASYRPLLNIMRTKWKARIGERKDLGVAIDLFSRLVPIHTSNDRPVSAGHRTPQLLPSNPVNLQDTPAENERWDLDDLQGLAYYALMLQGRQAWNRDPLLGREHRIRLLSGYHEMTRLCNGLPNHPPTFTHVSPSEAHTLRQEHPDLQPCPVPSSCREAWSQLWSEITRPDSDFASLALILYRASNSSSDFMGPVIAGSTPGNERADYMWKMMLPISVIQALIDNSIPREGLMHHDLNLACARRGLEAAKQDLESFRRRLMDFFDDVE